MKQAGVNNSLIQNKISGFDSLTSGSKDINGHKITGKLSNRNELQKEGNNMKESMDRLKNLKQEYTEKYNYSKFASGNMPSLKESLSKK